MRHAYPSDGERRVRSTKGVLIEESSTPDTVSHQALHLLSEPQLCSRRAMVGTDRLAGPPNSASERTKPVETISRQRDEHKERIQLSGHHRNQQRPQRGMRRGRSNQHAMPQASRPTNKPSRCVRLKALKVRTSKTRRKDTVVSLEPACAHGVCNEVWWRPCPTNLHHHSITALHQCTQARDYHSCFAQSNIITLAYGPPYSLSCGRQVPDVSIPHYRDARMQHSRSR